MKKQCLTALRVIVAVALYFLPIPYLNWSLSWFLNWLFRERTGVGCIFVQAFGRNSFSDDELVSIFTPMRNEANDDPIRVFGMLKAKNFDPGKTNIALAKVVIRLLRKQYVPVIAQWEVVYALWQIEPKGCEQMIRTNQVFTLWPRGDYYPTYEVKKDSIAVMKKWGLSDPLELAQQDMVVRALMILWHLGVNPSLHIARVPYDRKSVQFWTRNVIFWGIYEIVVRGHHIVHRWVSFSPPKE